MRDVPGFAEWWEGLLWHRVLMGAGMGLRPGRVGIAFFAVVIGAVLVGIGQAVDGRFMGGDGPAVASAFQPRTLQFLPWRWFISAPLSLVRHWPVTTLVMGPLLVVVWQVAAGAIARMTAVEIAHGKRMEWTEGLGFAAARWGSLVATVLGPLVLVWGAALLLAAFGALLLQWPLLNLLGGALYAAALMIGLLMAVGTGAYVIGFPMLAPALMCEGTDPVDAVQRSFAYVTARLPRTLWYLLLSGVGVAFTGCVVAVLAVWGIEFAAMASGAWAGVSGREMLWGGVPAMVPHPPGVMAEPTGTYALGSWLVRLWMSIPLTFVIATCLSCAASAGTMMYMAMRSVCDGQDLAELWTPGSVEATMADSLAGRGEITAKAEEKPGPQAGPAA